MEGGGPLVRRDGFTKTPWPGGQRKYTLSWTVPLCLPVGAEQFCDVRENVWFAPEADAKRLRNSWDDSATVHGRFGSGGLHSHAEGSPP